MILILFGVFFLMVFLNIPIAVSLGLTAMIGLSAGGFPFSMFPNFIYPFLKVSKQLYRIGLFPSAPTLYQTLPEEAHV